jgi:hypothetical protein
MIDLLQTRYIVHLLRPPAGKVQAICWTIVKAVNLPLQLNQHLGGFENGVLEFLELL